MASTVGTTGLAAQGISTTGDVHWNLPAAVLYEHALRRGEGTIAADGPLVCRTGQHTGRSPNDKFVVKEPSSEAHVHWGKVNRPLAPEHFAALRADIVAHLGDKELFVQNLHAGADPRCRLPVRMISEYGTACSSGTCHRPDGRQLAEHRQFTVICAPSFKADPARHGALDVAARPQHGGQECSSPAPAMPARTESIFTVLNYVLPLKGVLPMHCSASIGEAGDTALFFRAGRDRQDHMRATRSAASSATTSTGGATAASSTSKAAATPRPSSSRPS
ncbi:MAG: phosphoenolpyruvate carboxykinase (ATP) [Vicinamibacterales bacterium]